MSYLIIPNVGIDCPLPEAARLYAQAGLPIFACKPQSKIPLTSHGFKDATTDEAQIAAWWATWPDANIGLPMGKASGMCALDEDPRHGGSFNSLRSYGELPQSHRNRTGGGGSHMLLQHREGVTNSTHGKLPSGIDVRGEGGYILLPPSIHPSGRRYEVAEALPVALMPGWLYGLLSPKERPHLRPSAPAAIWVDRAVLRMVDGRGRNETGIWLAIQLRDSGLTQADATPHMEAYQSRVEALGDHAYTREEAYASLRSAYSRDRRETAGNPSQIGTVSDLPALTDESLTDVGNADRFAAEYGHKLKHVAGWGWTAYDGQRWVKGAEKQAQEWAKKCLLDLLSQAQSMDDRRLQVEIIGHVKRSLSAYHVGSMMTLASSDPRISAIADDFDQDHYLLNVANGTLNLRDGLLQAHHAGDRITHLAPVTFDPSADAPHFAKFLREVFDQDQEVVDYVQRLAGYTATGETREQIYMTLFGSGSNGKGTLTSCLAYVLGDYAETLSADTFTKPKLTGGQKVTPGLHKLPGKRFISAQEPEGETLNTALIKTLAGEDPISVNPKHRDEYTFKPTCKIWLASNARFAVEDATNATWRRTVPIDFPVSFVGREDKTLGKTLQDEAAGVLNWILEGAMLWYASGLGELPAAVAETKQDYRYEQDPSAEFFETRLIASPGSIVSQRDAYRTYEAWKSEHSDAPHVGERQFKRLCEAHGCRTRKSNGVMVVVDRALSAVGEGDREILTSFNPNSPLVTI